MYTPPPGLREPDEYAQMLKRMAILSALVAGISLVRYLLPFDQDLESAGSGTALVIGIALLPKVRVRFMVSAAAGVIALICAVVLALLIHNVFGFGPELVSFLAGTMMSSICWVGYVMMRPSS